MNGHIRSSNVGYDGTHGGFGYGSRNADGSRILEFADGLNLVICYTLFTKQEAKLVTYVAGPVKSTVDYIMVRQEDKAKVRNIKVISSEECVPKHKLLGSRNADGSRIFEFADGLNLVICNTLFMMQKAKLVTYVAGPVKSTVDY